MAAKTRRTYAGAAVSTTITAGINSTDSSITLTASTGWAAGPFYVVIDPGTSSEEKVYISSRSGTTLTVGTRGVDGTTGKSHTSGAVIYPVHTAIDSDEANELTAKYTTRGDIVYQGDSTFERLGVGTANYVLKTNGTDPSWGQVTEGGIADDAITAAKIVAGAVGSSEINSAIAGSGLAGGSGSALSVNVDNSTIEISTDTLRVKDSGVTLAKLASAVANSLVPVGTIAMYGGASAPTGWLLCNGDAIDGAYTSLRSIVGTNTPDLKGRFALGDNSTLTLLGTGGSTTIGTNNLPAHSHANTAVLASGTVTVTDAGHTHGSGSTGSTDLTHSHELEGRTINNTSHTHTGTQSFATGSTGSSVVSPAPTTETALSTHSHTIASATTGITASVGTEITVTNANTGGAEAYYQPYVVVNYIIKHD
jgi:microcystin-dependent protein